MLNSPELLVAWVSWQYRFPHKEEHTGSIPVATTRHRVIQ